jgi:16S rRNA (adenine1518-N6/adenine1519-N6)-dimethyltransferase
MVQPKKALGQHFLRDQRAAERIASSISVSPTCRKTLEIGPGTGVLTQFLLQRGDLELFAVEIDRESVVYLHEHYPQLKERLIEADVLKLDPSLYFGEEAFIVAGNFPYNISSQILFRVLDWKNQVSEVVGMFQKEVAERVCAGPGSKTYGILSVLLKAWFTAEYLFTVEPGAFHPPPKVRSGVIRLRRNERERLSCDQELFVKVVKAGFNQRRKTLRNSLKSAGLLKEAAKESPLLNKRPEQLSVSEFEELTALLQR